MVRLRAEKIKSAVFIITARVSKTVSVSILGIITIISLIVLIGLFLVLSSLILAAYFLEFNRYYRFLSLKVLNETHLKIQTLAMLLSLDWG